MTIPRSFKSWAVVGGKVREIVVDLTSADEVMSAWPVDVTRREPVALSVDDALACRTWAVKALAWLRVEAGRASEADLLLRSVESHHETLNAFLKNLGQRTGALAAAAADAYLMRCGDLMGPLRAAHMEDLVDRCAEEMRRQAEEVTRINFCAECLGPVVGASVHQHCAAEKAKP